MYGNMNRDGKDTYQLFPSKVSEGRFFVKNFYLSSPSTKRVDHGKLGGETIRLPSIR